MKKMSLYSALYEFIGFPFVIEKKIHRKYQVIFAKLKQSMFMSKYLKQLFIDLKNTMINLNEI